MTEPRDEPPMPVRPAPPGPAGGAAGQRGGAAAQPGSATWQPGEPESEPESEFGSGQGAVGWTVHQSTWGTAGAAGPAGTPGSADPLGAAGRPREPYPPDNAGAARPWATIAGVAVAGPVGDAEGVGDPQDAEDEEPYQRRDWAWVEEWRESGERPAWAPGLALAAFVAVVVGLAVLVLSKGLSDMLWLAIAANVLVAAGLAPALWLSRHLPVLRWISAGAAVGVVVGWVGALIS